MRTAECQIVILGLDLKFKDRLDSITRKDIKDMCLRFKNTYKDEYAEYTLSISKLYQEVKSALKF